MRVFGKLSRPFLALGISNFRSIRHKSVTVGTDFDKIALAVVLSQRATSDPRQNILVLPNAAPSGPKHQNGSVKSLIEEPTAEDIENRSFIIENPYPLADISTPGTPNTGRKSSHSPSNSSYNLMVKVVPYTWFNLLTYSFTKENLLFDTLNVQIVVTYFVKFVTLYNQARMI